MSALAGSPPDKQRPVLVLTRDSAIGHLTEVILDIDDGMKGPCAVNLHNADVYKRQICEEAQRRIQGDVDGHVPKHIAVDGVGPAVQQNPEGVAVVMPRVEFPGVERPVQLSLIHI